MEKPTKAQQKVLTFYKSHHKKKGYSPSLQGVCDHFGWTSTSSAYRHVKELIRKGYLKPLPHMRGFKVVA